MAAVAGMTTGTLAWAALAVLGVGAVFSTHPLLRQTARVAGGLYLLQLAVKLWRPGTTPTSPTTAHMSGAAAFRVGFITSALNPKIALFYGSVFATALPATPSMLHTASAVGLVYANSIVWHTGLALALSHGAVQSAYLRHFAVLNRVSSALVGVFGARLLAETFQEWHRRTA